MYFISAIVIELYAIFVANIILRYLEKSNIYVCFSIDIPACSCSTFNLRLLSYEYESSIFAIPSISYTDVKNTKTFPYAVYRSI